MNKAMIPVVLAGILASTSAFAHRGWDDDEGYRPYRPQQIVAYPATTIVYQVPPVAYAPPPPPVIYRERVVYQEVPVYKIALIEQEQCPHAPLDRIAMFEKLRITPEDTGKQSHQNRCFHNEARGNPHREIPVG